MNVDQIGEMLKAMGGLTGGIIHCKLLNRKPLSDLRFLVTGCVSRVYNIKTQGSRQALESRKRKVFRNMRLQKRTRKPFGMKFESYEQKFLIDLANLSPLLTPSSFEAASLFPTPEEQAALPSARERLREILAQHPVLNGEVSLTLHIARALREIWESSVPFARGGLMFVLKQYFESAVGKHPARTATFQGIVEYLYEHQNTLRRCRNPRCQGTPLFMSTNRVMCSDECARDMQREAHKMTMRKLRRKA